ncbi:MAG: protein-tyrosine-phosphatase [Pirellulales bacterium]
MNERVSTTKLEMYPDVQQYLEKCISRFDSISEQRKSELAIVANYIQRQAKKGLRSKLTFICTHNSRRSHLSQVWAAVAASYFGLANVETFSGGTEATAFNPRSVAALKRCGLKILADDDQSSNPRYSVFYTDSISPLFCFSKVFNESPNPTENYCAIMTCSQADDACPVVMGCDLRVPIRYEDPKVADDTPAESQRYDERSEQICTEMLYMMSLVDSTC